MVRPCSRISLEQSAVAAHVVGDRIEEDMAVCPGRLGPVHRQVRPLQQRLGVVGVARIESNADTHPDLDGRAVDLKRFRQRGYHPGCDPFGQFAIGATDGKGELVTAKSCQRILRSRELRKPAGDGDEKPIAGGVAVNVVDGFEAVQVEREERERVLGAAGVDKTPVEALVEQTAVGNAGQRIVSGEGACLRLGVPAPMDFAGQPVCPNIQQEGEADRADDEQIGVFVELPRLVRAGDLVEPVERIRRMHSGECNCATQYDRKFGRSDLVPDPGADARQSGKVSPWHGFVAHSKNAGSRHVWRVGS
jgi:hypothetical protein